MDGVDLSDLIQRAKSGDQGASVELLRRFEGDVRTVVRGRLPRVLRSKFDSMDFVQAVWTSVLARDRAAPGQFEDSQHFRNYLAGVARNKVFEEHRRRTQTRKYDLKREEPLYVLRGDREVPRDVAGHDPTPSQDAQAAERLAQLLEGRTPLERQVVELRRRGLTFAEIAGRVGVHEAVLRRIIDTLRNRLEDRNWR